MDQTAHLQTVALVSLGCPKNLVDSERMLGLLSSGGVVPVESADDADVVVINTCGFLEDAKEESLEVIEQAAVLRRSGKVKRLIVAGCLVQRHRDEIMTWCPDVDALVGVFDREHILEAVTGSSPRIEAAPEDEPVPPYWIARNALEAAESQGVNTVNLTVRGRSARTAGAEVRALGYYESDAARFRLTPRHYAYLRMSEGCNQNCTFCTIPSIRGKMRSKPIDHILAEARELMADGAFELNLIGQDTTSYGDDTGYEPGLAGLLTELNDCMAQEQGAGWIRLMYAYPSNFTDAMIDAIASLPHIVKYVDMPLQHINDRILTTMRRNTSRLQICTLLDKLRERIPGLAIRTTFITGFPGESEAEHEELVEFVGSFGFDMMGVFPFSPEPGTPAYKLQQQHPELVIPADVVKRRHHELMTVQQQIAFEQAEYLASLYQEAVVGTQPGVTEALESAVQFDVLIEKQDEESETDLEGPDAGNRRRSVGRCYHQAPEVDSVTFVDAQTWLAPGDLVRCAIVDSQEYDLVGRPVSELLAGS
ncbi:MAG: 30S ribosomal protein S12 methylthiotransferase RimO [Planctomycetes bacterium]|nr:30S ribosomal protein S12 methylthiotransferase RimO [Planctomycetota bacterium]NOG55222.1 30S ribosomal protein S12 methylthiotransferase RimO [Planctomycetota bacterium]